MSAKILPFRVPKRANPDEPAPFVSCPYCGFFTDKKLALAWHMQEIHARAMELRGHRKSSEWKSS